MLPDSIWLPAFDDQYPDSSVVLVAIHVFLRSPSMFRSSRRYFDINIVLLNWSRELINEDIIKIFPLAILAGFDFFFLKETDPNITDQLTRLFRIYDLMFIISENSLFRDVRTASSIKIEGYFPNDNIMAVIINYDCQVRGIPLAWGYRLYQ